MSKKKIKNTYENKKDEDEEEVTAESAGFIFYRNNTFLTGYSTHLKKWSGFGGKKEGNETALQTAIREIIEEIYGFTPDSTLIEILTKIEIKQTINRKGYILFIADIDVLKWISACLILYDSKSPYYNSIPKNIIEIVTDRIFNPTNEVSSIEFMSHHIIKKLNVDAHFLKDMNIIVSKLNNESHCI